MFLDESNASLTRALWTLTVSGAIPVSIGGLSKLECLDLSHNEFQGDIPRSLGGLVSLRRMLLDHNQLFGDVPSTLGCLSNLRWVDFTNNEFKVT